MDGVVIALAAAAGAGSMVRSAGPVVAVDEGSRVADGTVVAARDPVVAVLPMAGLVVAVVDRVAPTVVAVHRVAVTEEEVAVLTGALVVAGSMVVAEVTTKKTKRAEQTGSALFFFGRQTQDRL